MSYPVPLKTVTRLINQLWFPQVAVFVVCLAVLLETLAPTLYTLDSAEFAIGAATLGIVHAPGYALYLTAAHSFTWLPVGDLGFRVNLFSAVNLALVAPILYALLLRLTGQWWAALAAALGFMWSYYVWATGIVAEIYASQIFTLALMLAVLALLYRSPDPASRSRLVITLGGVFGLAVSTHPASILFAPGMVISFRLLNFRWRDCVWAALLAVSIVGISLIYFPVRYRADPALNLAGVYNTQGTFEAIDLRTPGGIWWLLSGRQFSGMFFADGLLPDLGQFFSLFWGNYLGVGVLIGGLGIYDVYQTERRLFWIWIAFTLPYTYFYACYGVSDVETMFGPTYLLWAIMIAFGLRRLTPSSRLRPILAFGLPMILLVINFPLLNLSSDRTVRTRAEHLLAEIPPNAVVLGHWWDIVPLQYLQMVEHQRTDLALRNQFLFSKADYQAYLAWYLESSPDPLVILGNAPPELPATVHASMSLLTLNISYSGKKINDPVIAGIILIRPETSP
ncbi:MAG: DUF2723 domain-containing protein [Chloroflexi bacterium]|nr:DUF2723 domain-containing protein [Chloroflexota bacterium]